MLRNIKQLGKPTIQEEAEQSKEEHNYELYETKEGEHHNEPNKINQ